MISGVTRPCACTVPLIQSYFHRSHEIIPARWIDGVDMASIFLSHHCLMNRIASVGTGSLFGVSIARTDSAHRADATGGPGPGRFILVGEGIVRRKNSL
jgi:hypothetical protein